MKFFSQLGFKPLEGWDLSCASLASFTGQPHTLFRMLGQENKQASKQTLQRPPNPVADQELEAQRKVAFQAQYSLGWDPLLCAPMGHCVLHCTSRTTVVFLYRNNWTVMTCLGLSCPSTISESSGGDECCWIDYYILNTYLQYIIDTVNVGWMNDWRNEWTHGFP